MQISPIQPLLRSGRSPRLRLTMRILRASVCTGFPSLRPARLGCCNMNRSSCRWSALPRCCASVAPFRASTRKDSPEICCVFHSAGARSSSSASGLWRPQHHPVVYHPDFKLSPLPDSHRFPMPKDHLLYVRLQELGLATAQNTFQPAYPDEETLALCHDLEYIRSFLDGTIPESALRKINLPWSRNLVQRTLIGVGSAITAAQMALLAGVACMCNGGTHHAHAAHGGGWCIFNDQAVAARKMQQEAGVNRVLFVDLDVHHGDGTASIFAGDPSVFTWSVHCDDQAFPVVRPPSDLDTGLPAKTGDSEYLSVVSATLPQLLDELHPDMVFYNAGVDPHEDDSLGLLSLTNEGIAQRDRLVMQECAVRKIPVAVAIGGGYSPDHGSIVERHLSVHVAARDALQEHGPWGRVKIRK